MRKNFVISFYFSLFPVEREKKEGFWEQEDGYKSVKLNEYYRDKFIYLYSNFHQCSGSGRSRV